MVDTKKIKNNEHLVRATQFENSTIDFLKSLKFEDVNGGRNFSIGGEQVDAIGGIDGTLLIFECKYKDYRDKATVRPYLKDFRGRMSFIAKGIKKDPIYAKYSNVVFILAVKNVDISPTDKEYAKKAPKVFLFTDEELQYYRDLTKNLGKYARFSFLGELNVYPKNKIPLRIPAVRVKISGYTVYSFAMKAKQLLEIAYVARREQGNEHYYQRLVTSGRLNAIKKYVDEENGFFPNNVILSITSKTSFFKSKGMSFENDVSDTNNEMSSWLEFGILQFPEQYRSCWIIDGQHRLYSFSRTKRDQPLFVTAFDDLPLEDQTNFFIKINEEQKPVNPDLIWDLQGQMRPESEDGVVSNIVRGLNKLEPFKDKIYIPLQGKKQRGMLKFSGFCIALSKGQFLKKKEDKGKGKKIKQANPFYSTDLKTVQSKATKQLAQFFKLVDDVFSKDTKDGLLFTNGGLSVLIYIFIKLTIHHKGILEKTTVKRYLDALNSYLKDSKLNELRQRISSEGGRTGVTNEFIAGIARESGDQDLIEIVEDHKILGDIRSIEDNLRDFLNSYFTKKVDKDWIQSRTSESVRDRLKDSFKRKSPNDIRENLYEFLTLGHIRDIMFSEANWKLLNNVFVNMGGYTSKEELEGAIDRISKVRNPQAHTEKMVVKISAEDEQLIKINIRKINSCIQNV